MQIHCSTCSVILNVMATQYTCLFNGVYCPHWLVQWSHHCLHMHNPVHFPWLPGYIDVTQTCLIILIMVGPFQDSPRILNTYLFNKVSVFRMVAWDGTGFPAARPCSMHWNTKINEALSLALTGIHACMFHSTSTHPKLLFWPLLWTTAAYQCLPSTRAIPHSSCFSQLPPILSESTLDLWGDRPGE